jgi:hypothetical protein
MLLDKFKPEGEMIPDHNDGSKSVGAYRGTEGWFDWECRRDPWLARTRIGESGMSYSNWLLQSAVVCSSETSDPTGLVTVRTAIVPIDSPRRYIRYAATAPATIVPQNNALFITAPFARHQLGGELVLAIFRMQKAAWRRGGARKNRWGLFASWRLIVRR